MIKHPLSSFLDWKDILKVLADETRLFIIHNLLKNELSVNEIAETLELEVYNISRHLRILETSGLIEKRKKGINRVYKISDDLRSQYSEEKQVLDLGCCKFEFRMLQK